MRPPTATRSSRPRGKRRTSSGTSKRFRVTLGMEVTWRRGAATNIYLGIWFSPKPLVRETRTHEDRHEPPGKDQYLENCFEVRHGWLGRELKKLLPTGSRLSCGRNARRRK